MIGQIASAAIGVGGQLIGGYLGQKAERESMREANRFSAREATKNRQFQERMASTQYQRAMSDMEQAGLNPIVAMGGGASPSAAPSGSAPSGTKGNQGQIIQNAVNNAVNSALNSKQIKNQEKLIDAQVANQHASAQKTMSEKQTIDYNRGISTEGGRRTTDNESIIGKILGDSKKILTGALKLPKIFKSKKQRTLKKEIKNIGEQMKRYNKGSKEWKQLADQKKKLSNAYFE